MPMACITAKSPGKCCVCLLIRYYVGVLNKQTMQMEVHNAQLFNMQPVIPGKRKNKTACVESYSKYKINGIKLLIIITFLTLTPGEMTESEKPQDTKTYRDKVCVMSSLISSEFKRGISVSIFSWVPSSGGLVD